MLVHEIKALRKLRSALTLRWLFALYLFLAFIFKIIDLARGILRPFAIFTRPDSKKETSEKWFLILPIKQGADFFTQAQTHTQTET